MFVSTVKYERKDDYIFINLATRGVYAVNS